MKTRLCLFVLLLSSLGASLASYAQGEKKPRTEADYTARTLRELAILQPQYIADNPEYKNAKDLAIVFHGGADLLPSRVRVIYDGTKNPLNEYKKYLILEWAKRFAGAPEFYTSAYETEVLFTENGENYSLAVKKELLPRLDQELKKGDAVELFLIKLGNTRIADKLEPVLLVERFVKQ